MPARSQTNATRLPSGDHIAFDGCLISISCSTVSLGADGVCSTALAAHAEASAAISKVAMCFMTISGCRVYGYPTTNNDTVAGGS